MLRRLFCVLGLLLVLLPLQGQDPHYFAFSTHDGLPSSEVYSVVLDEKGRPWFATDRGACSYDGYSFSRYGRPEGLSNNTCLGIRKDSQGRLWFMGLDGSLSLRDEEGLHPFVWNSQIDSLLRQHQVLVDSFPWGGERSIP